MRDDQRLAVYSTTSSAAPEIAAPGYVTFARWLDERSLIALHDHELWRIAFDAAPVQLAEHAAPFALDPARQRCAWIDAACAPRVLELASGAARLLAAGDLTQAEVCGWLAAPDAIAIRSTTTPIVVDRIDPSTGSRTRHLEVRPPPLGLKAVDIFVLHAGGARSAYSYGEETSQLFVMTPIQ